MMNPFIQKALNDVRSYPTQSVVPRPRALDTATDSPPAPHPESLHWLLERDRKSGGLIVDQRLRVKLVSGTGQQDAPPQSATMSDVFALGDVAVLQGGALPATAQVANQEAQWLARRLNRGDLLRQGFSFKNLGIMTYLGNWKAIMQTGGHNEITG